MTHCPYCAENIPLDHDGEHWLTTPDLERLIREECEAPPAFWPDNLKGMIIATPRELGLL